MHLKRKKPCVKMNHSELVKDEVKDVVKDEVEDQVKDEVCAKKKPTRMMISFIKNNLERTIWRFLFLHKIYNALRVKFEN